MKRSVRLNLMIAMAITAVVAGMVAVAPAARANTANTLKVSPVRSDIEIQPGGRKAVQTTVTNLTDQPITLRPINNDFIAGDERGTPALILDADKFAPTHSLKRFMEPLPDITIPAGQAKTVEVVINVPADAQAGGYFGAVRFAPTTADGGGQVNLSASAASLMLLSVPGDTVEKLDLTEFVIKQNDKSNTIFNTSDGLQASVRFENKGNVQIGPFGKISVSKGNTVVHEHNFNDKNPRDVILPNSARRWDVPLNNIGNFGKYTVSATFTYGADNQTVEVSESFWVIPWGVIIGAIIGLLLLIGLIIGIWLFLRGYKRRILRSHGDGNGSGGLRRL